MIYEYIKKFLKDHIRNLLALGVLSIILSFLYLTFSIPVYESKISVIQEDYGITELQGKDNSTIGFGIFSNNVVNTDYEEAKLFSRSREFLFLLSENTYYKRYFFESDFSLGETINYQSDEVFLALMKLNDTLSVSKNPVNDIWLFTVRSADEEIVYNLGLSAIQIINSHLSREKISRKKTFISSLEDKLTSTKESSIKIYLSNTLAKLYEDVAKIEIQEYPLFRPIESIKPSKRLVWPRPAIVFLLSLILSFTTYSLILALRDLLKR